MTFNLYFIQKLSSKTIKCQENFISWTFMSNHFKHWRGQLDNWGRSNIHIFVFCVLNFF